MVSIAQELFSNEGEALPNSSSLQPLPLLTSRGQGRAALFLTKASSHLCWLRGAALSSTLVEFPPRWRGLGSSGTTPTPGLLYSTCSSMVGIAPSRFLASLKATFSIYAFILFIRLCFQVYPKCLQRRPHSSHLNWLSGGSGVTGWHTQNTKRCLKRWVCWCVSLPEFMFYDNNGSRWLCCSTTCAKKVSQVLEGSIMCR